MLVAFLRECIAPFMCLFDCVSLRYFTLLYYILIMYPTTTTTPCKTQQGFLLVVCGHGLGFQVVLRTLPNPMDLQAPRSVRYDSRMEAAGAVANCV